MKKGGRGRLEEDTEDDGLERNPAKDLGYQERGGRKRKRRKKKTIRKEKKDKGEMKKKVKKKRGLR